LHEKVSDSGVAGTFGLLSAVEEFSGLIVPGDG
jgi:hypothetical protein